VADREISLVHARSPGMKHKHYAPKAKVIVVEGEPEAVRRKVQELAEEHRKNGRSVGVLATDENKRFYKANVIKSLGARRDLSSAARNLFKMLREFDEEKVDIIIAETKNAGGYSSSSWSMSSTPFSEIRKRAGTSGRHGLSMTLAILVPLLPLRRKTLCVQA